MDDQISEKMQKVTLEQQDQLFFLLLCSPKEAHISSFTRTLLHKDFKEAHDTKYQ